MLFFFPTGTDAPLYHWPWATGGLILLNILILILEFAFGIPSFFLLNYGEFNPISWFTSICMHQGIGHLIGNIVGIGLFGWIIEGKVGWWRFLLIYFGIGVASCGFEQTIMLLADSGSSLGASGVVFGLIAIAMIWAPENEVYITMFFILFFRPFVHQFEVSVSTLGFVMIGMEFLLAAFTGFQMSSAVLHLMGAVPGFAIAYLMLRWRRVDCDGYDFISLLKGKRGQRTLTVADEKAAKGEKEQAKSKARTELEDGLAMVEKYVNSGHYDLALNRFNMLRKKNHSIVMTHEQYVTIIRAFDADEATKPKSVPLIESYLENYDHYKTTFTLMLARIHILMQDRPRRGIKVLKTLDWQSLTDKQKEFLRRIVQRANKMIEDGVLEIDD
jgi:membrane associated rhomboid family serine protease